MLYIKSDIECIYIINKYQESMIGYNTHALNDPFCQLTLSNRLCYFFKTMKPHPPMSTSNEEILENEKR